MVIQHDELAEKACVLPTEKTRQAGVLIGHALMAVYIDNRFTATKQDCSRVCTASQAGAVTSNQLLVIMNAERHILWQPNMDARVLTAVQLVASDFMAFC